ncbi:MAG: hypothetical protein WBB47_00295 [Paenisporosarcina sp.]
MKRYADGAEKNKIEDEIDYVVYGEEGQRGVRTLTFDGKQMNVSHSVDGKFIEEFNCKDIMFETKIEVDKYILSQCTGDFELLSVSNKE